VEIFASGGLDEDRIAELVAGGAPIDGFGVGTDMGVSRDAPVLDMAYKLTAYAGRGRLKTSPGKPILPGRKQVFRREEAGAAAGDVIARAGEEGPGRPLLERVMAGGRTLAEDPGDLERARERARREIGALPARVRGLAPADPPYPVAVSAELAGYAEEVRKEVEAG
jgi:nicotinate phosphoribosyltransferase